MYPSRPSAVARRDAFNCFQSPISAPSLARAGPRASQGRSQLEEQLPAPLWELPELQLRWRGRGRGRIAKSIGRTRWKPRWRQEVLGLPWRPRSAQLFPRQARGRAVHLNAETPLSVSKVPWASLSCGADRIQPLHSAVVGEVCFVSLLLPHHLQADTA